MTDTNRTQFYPEQAQRSAPGGQTFQVTRRTHDGKTVDRTATLVIPPSYDMTDMAVEVFATVGVYDNEVTLIVECPGKKDTHVNIPADLWSHLATFVEREHKSRPARLRRLRAKLERQDKPVKNRKAT